MIFDTLLSFCDGKAATAAVTTDAVEVPVNTGMMHRLADGAPMCIAVVSKETDLAGTSLTVKVQHSDEKASGFTDLVASGTLTPDQVNDCVGIPLPLVHKKFLRLVITPTSITAGKVSAFLTDNIDANPAFKRGETFE